MVESAAGSGMVVIICDHVDICDNICGPISAIMGLHILVLCFYKQYSTEWARARDGMDRGVAWIWIPRRCYLIYHNLGGWDSLWDCGSCVPIRPA